MSIFDIMGPLMVGPSSSHTAGAAKIGYISSQLLGEVPSKVKIYLHGSFADTGAGHGTDKALLAGLLGMREDDERIPNSMEWADKIGMEYEFSKVHLKNVGPNTVKMHLYSKKDRELEIVATSIGGGRISIEQIDGIDTHFSGDFSTLIVHNIDQPGHVAEVTSALAHKSVNIASLQLFRNKKGGYAVMIVETDQNIPSNTVKWIEHLEGVIKVTYLNVIKEVENVF